MSMTRSDILPILPDCDLILPIFEARTHVERCLISLERHLPPQARLVLIDDASQDPVLLERLGAEVARRPGTILLRNPKNTGFVGSANRGLGLALESRRDACLLNSDTEVSAGFLERLAACAHAGRESGIASPFSNNGTILSVPVWLRENAIPEPFDVDAFAEIVRRASRRVWPEIPTAVGFCMYIRADVLRTIDLFDQENFGRGYGEENDFCARARLAGYRSRLADDVFVAHVGRASFGAEGDAREDANNSVMARLHPDYHDLIRTFIQLDPLRGLRSRIARETERTRRAAARGRRSRHKPATAAPVQD